MEKEGAKETRENREQETLAIASFKMVFILIRHANST